MPTDYSKGKIYKLSSLIDNNWYVGSTFKTLTIRLRNHKYSAENGTSQKVLDHFNKIGLDNMKIELLEACTTATTKREVREREQYYINKLKEELGEECCLNVGNAIKDVERRKEWTRQWNEKNKEKETERKRLFHLANKEERNRRNKERYDNGRNAIMAEKVLCPLCTQEITRSCLNRHQRSQKCRNNRPNQSSVASESNLNPQT